MKIVVADSSPLIVIATSELLPTLERMIEDVVIPNAVYAECVADMSLPGARAIRSAVEAQRIHVRPDPDPAIEDSADPAPELDSGERAAILLALALQCPVLIDERLGREAARRKGLVVIGSAGFLVEAKRQGLIPAVAPILQEWQRSGYYLGSALMRAVLVQAGEA